MTAQELRNTVHNYEAGLKYFKQQLDEQLRTNEFEIDYDVQNSYGYIIKSTGEIIASRYHELKEEISFGTYRKTRELSEIARDNMRARNKLEELVHWLEPDWKPDWNNNHQRKCCIYCAFGLSKFKYHYLFDNSVIGAVFMSEQTAEKICNALNDGLLPELAEILKG